MAICMICGERFPDARFDLGYDTCLACGEKEAKAESEAKAKRTAPSYNKGAYQYITDGDGLNALGRKI